jgi:2'-5' RNA ligase
VRAFLAVPVSAEEALPNLRRLLREAGEVPGLRTVRSDQLHFTLKFFEELTGDMRPAAERAAAKAAALSTPFSLALGGLGSFPARGPARVLWVGCRDGADALVALAAALDRELSREGFPPESRPFSPHLTVGRVKDPRAGRAVAGFATAGADLDAGRLLVAELVLFGSVLGPSRAIHTPLARFPLAGS